MQTEKDVVVGKKKYKVVSIPPTLALEYYLTLQKFALGPVGEMLDNSLAKAMPDQETIEKNDLFAKFMSSDINISKALSKLAESLEPKKLTDLFKGLIENGARNADGTPFIFEEEFHGQIQTLFGLVSEVVTHNYPNFFGILLDLIRVKKADTTQAK